MSKKFKSLTIIITNLAIFFLLIGIIISFPIFTYNFYKLFTSEDKKSKNYNYQNPKIIKETDGLKQKFSDTEGLIYVKYTGKYVNIDKIGNRKTDLSEEILLDQAEYFFFGPSVIWGYGEEDKKTIPSIFSQTNNVFVKNFSSNGYTSHYSLSKLINFYIDNPKSDKKRVIIFNDGPLDYFSNCKNNDFILKSNISDDINSLITSKTNTKNFEFSFKYIIYPFKSLINKMINKVEMFL